MKLDLAFDDVLINPSFSYIESRKDLKLEHDFLGMNIRLPIMNANMDTISSPEMSATLAQNGAMGTMHRFLDIDKNVDDFYKTCSSQINAPYINISYYRKPLVSIGIGNLELERAKALYEAGASHFIIDVANGANIAVVEQYDRLRGLLKDNVAIIVGNFANGKTIEEFNSLCKSSTKMDAVKSGVGGGSVCSTRIVTGIGRSTLSSILDCSTAGIPIIADGGIRSSGDICKALVAGASAVMVGSLFAGTKETPGEVQYVGEFGDILVKKYRGSASKESYEVQGKLDKHRTPEGVSTIVPYKGPVEAVLQELEAGIRSSMSYVGARSFKEYIGVPELVQVTNSGIIESTPHGKKN